MKILPNLHLRSSYSFKPIGNRFLFPVKSLELLGILKNKRAMSEIEIYDTISNFNILDDYLENP